MPFTVAQHTAMVAAALKGTAYSGFATVYLSLHTANPTDAGTSEATGGSYARQVIAIGTVSAGSVSNSGVVSFTGMPAGTFTHFGIWSAVTAGTLIGYGALSTPRTTTSGDTLTAAASSFTMALSQA